MRNTIKAVIDEKGAVRLLEPIRLPKPPLVVSEAALLSEAALAEDWNRPEEDEAWSFLPSARS